MATGSPSQPCHRQHGGRGMAGLAQAAQGGVVVALGKPPAVRVHHQGMVGIGGLRPAHELLQEPVQVGCWPKVDAARDEGDTGQRVVVCGAQMVARRRIASPQHHVAEPLGRARHAALRGIGQAERRDRGGGAAHVEAPGVRLAGGDPLLPRGGVQVAAGAGVERRAVRAMRRRRGGRHFARDFRPAAEAGIEEAARLKGCQIRPA